MMSTELKLRIISAILLGGVVLIITWVGGYSFELLWAVAAILILYESNSISASAIGLGPKLISYLCLFLILASWLVGEHTTSLILFVASMIGLFAWELFLRKTPWASIGLLYAALPFFTITQLRGEASDSLVAVIILFACVWGADIFAYIAGRSIGGPKLAPVISPNKTWSGFFGSLFGAVFIAFGVVSFMGYHVSLLFFIVVVVLAVISQIGDLIESSFKRKFDVKDSGKIIPGHGGVLDRIDGLIFAGILLWLILFSLKYFAERNISLPELFVDRFLS